MNKLIKFGEDVEGYNIPVMNEREIRAAAGILFLVSLMHDKVSEKPHALFGKQGVEQIK